MKQAYIYILEFFLLLFSLTYGYTERMIFILIIGVLFKLFILFSKLEKKGEL